MNTLKGCLILFLFSSVAGLLFNAFSPYGISLVGEWDTSQGVVSAVPKTHSAVSDLEIKDVTVAKKIFDARQAVFVDARSEEAFIEGHIKGAVSLPISSFLDEIEAFMSKYPLSTHIVTYCSGRECEDSLELATSLIQMGYDRVNVYIDGYPVWQKKGYPVDTGHDGD